MRLASQPHHREIEFSTKMAQVLTTHVTQLYMLEVLPDTFCRVQLRRISRQLLKVNVLRPPISHKASDLFAMDRRAVPDHQQFALPLIPNVLQKAHTIHTRQRPLASQRQEMAPHRNPTHHRQMRIAQDRFKDRRLCSRRIGSDHAGQQVKARFINKTMVRRSLLAFFSTPARLRCASKRWPSRPVAHPFRRAVAASTSRLSTGGRPKPYGTRPRTLHESPRPRERTSKAHRESHTPRLRATGDRE
jgi:hypothetical protein